MGIFSKKKDVFKKVDPNKVSLPDIPTILDERDVITEPPVIDEAEVNTTPLIAKKPSAKQTPVTNDNLEDDEDALRAKLKLLEETKKQRELEAKRLEEESKAKESPSAETQKVVYVPRVVSTQDMLNHLAGQNEQIWAYLGELHKFLKDNLQ